MGLTICTVDADIKIDPLPLPKLFTTQTKVANLTLISVEGTVRTSLTRRDLEHLVTGLQALLARR